MVALLSASVQEDACCELIDSSACVEELRPIRIGAMAVQPQPDLADRVYVGRASMLPADLRALCSCAGLFYVHVIREVTDDLFRVAVAALPRYFSADAQCRTRHVRPHLFSDEQMSQLLEWDRSLAGMETGDVRGLLMAKRLPRIQQQQETIPALPISKEIQTDTVPEPTTSRQEAPRQVCDRAGVLLPIDAIRDLVSPDASFQSSRHCLILLAVLRHLRAQRLAERRWEERQAIELRERRIRQVYQQRDHLPLQKLVEMTPIYGHGKQSEIIACRIDIDLLAA